MRVRIAYSHHGNSPQPLQPTSITAMAGRIAAGTRAKLGQSYGVAAWTP